MRRFALPLALALLLPPPVAGQKAIGVHGGLTSSTVTNQGFPTSSRTGFNLGGALYFSESSATDWSFGLSYTQKGVRAQGQGVAVGLDFSYVEALLLLRRNFDFEGPALARVHLGTSLGYQLSCALGGSSGGTSVSRPCEGTSIDPVEFDIGILAGVGGAWQTEGSMMLTADLLYNFGGVSVQAATEEKNRTFMLRLGVEFPR